MSNSPFGNGGGSDGSSGGSGLIKPPAGSPLAQPTGSPAQRTNPKSVSGDVVPKPMPPAQRVPADPKPFNAK